MDQFKNLLTALIEKKSLSFEKAEGLMTEIMSGRISDIRLSSLLTVLKIKGETAEEIAGFASSMNKFSIKLNVRDKNTVDLVGTGGDGANTINISTAAAIVTAASGVTVAKHGNRAASSTSGSADILGALGININIPPEKVEKCINNLGFGFMFAPVFHPAMKYAAPVRKELKIRTVFNILGPLTSPAGIKRAVIGVYSKELCRAMSESAQLNGFEHLMVVHGNDGLDEITTTDTTHMCVLRNGNISEFEFDPADYGIQRAIPENLKGGTAIENAGIIKDIFEGGNKWKAAKDIIILNAAAAIIVSGNIQSWPDALASAEKAIDSGAANQKLIDIIRYTNSIS